MSEDNNKRPFNKLMREATAEVHSVSDALINAKLGFALSNTRVWSEGLLAFYEVFKYLEEAMTRLEHTIIGEMDVPGIRRLQGFEKDLSFYYGSSWKEYYEPRESVKEYINHLKNIENDNHILLIAYIYHLYMGIFSGGQILKKKRTILSKITFSNKENSEGLNVMAIPSGMSVYLIKKKLITALNTVAESLDAEAKKDLLEESKTVFLLNNKLVQSIETSDVILHNLTKGGLVVVMLAVILLYIFKW